YAPTGKCPVHLVTWYEAAEYCNWLSEQEGIDKEEWCYVRNAAGAYADGMKVKPNYLHLRGYRLPAKRNGNMRAGLGRRRAGITARRKNCWGSMPGMRRTHGVGGCSRWAVCGRTIWACSTCWGTLWSGARIVPCITPLARTLRIKKILKIKIA